MSKECVKEALSVSDGLIVNNDNQLKESQDISVCCQLQQVSDFHKTNANTQAMLMENCFTNTDTCDDGLRSRNDTSNSVVVPAIIVNPLFIDSIEHTASGQQSVHTVTENCNTKLALDVSQKSSGNKHNAANLSCLELGVPIVKIEQGLHASFNESPIGMTAVGDMTNSSQCRSGVSASEEKCVERDAVCDQLTLREGQAVQTNLKSIAIEEICPPRTENSFNVKIFELHELMRMAMNGVDFLSLIPPGTAAFYRTQVFHLIANKYKVTHNNMDIDNNLFTELIASSYFTESEVTRLKHALESRLMSCYLKDPSQIYSFMNDGMQGMFTDNIYQTPNLLCSKLDEQKLLRHQDNENVSVAVTSNASVTLGSKTPSSSANTSTSWTTKKLAHYNVTEYGTDGASGRSLTSAVVEKQADEIEMVKKAFTLKPHQDSSVGHTLIGHSPAGHTPVGCSPLGLDFSHSTHLGVSATETDMITNTCSSNATDNNIELERELKCNDSEIEAAAQSYKLIHVQPKLTKAVDSNQNTYTGYKCHICESACSEDAFWKHMLSNHIDKQTAQETQAMLYCSHCLEEQDSIGGLRVHESSIHLSKYPCYFCGLSVDSEELNLEHVVAEHCYRHTCRVCKVEFINKAELKQHCASLNHNPARMIGSQSELYHCVFCNLKFCKAYTVKKHIKIHDFCKIWYDKEKKCTSCSRRFLDDTALNFHLGQDARSPRCAPPINRLSLESFLSQFRVIRDTVQVANHQQCTTQQHAPSHSITKLLSEEAQSRQKVEESSDMRYLTVRNISIKYPARPFRLLCQLGAISEMQAFTVLDRLLHDVLSMYPDVIPLSHNNVLKVNEKLLKLLISYGRSEQFTQWLKTIGVDPLPLELTMSLTSSNQKMAVKNNSREHVSVASSAPYSLLYSAPSCSNRQLVSGKHSQILPQTVQSGKPDQTLPRTVQSGKPNHTVKPAVQTAPIQQTIRNKYMTSYPNIIPKPCTADIPKPVKVCSSVPCSTSHLQTMAHLMLVPGKGHGTETHQQVGKKDHLVTNRIPASHIQTELVDCRLSDTERKVYTLDTIRESFTMGNTNSSDNKATCNLSTSAYRLIAPKPNSAPTTAKDCLLQSSEMIDLVNNTDLPELEKSQTVLGVIQTNELQLNNLVPTAVSNNKSEHKCVEKKANRKKKPRAATEVKNHEERNFRPRKAAKIVIFDDYNYETDEELWKNLSDVDMDDLDDDDEWKPTYHVKFNEADRNKSNEENSQYDKRESRKLAKFNLKAGYTANKCDKNERTPESDCTESFISSQSVQSHQKKEIFKKTLGEEDVKQRSRLSMYELVEARRGIKRNRSNTSSINDWNVLKRLKFSENNSVAKAFIKCCYVKVEKNELVEKLAQMDKYSGNGEDMSSSSKVKIARKHHCIDNITESILDEKSSDNDCVKPCITGKRKRGRPRKVRKKAEEEAEVKNIQVINMPESEELGMIEKNRRHSLNMYETTRQRPNLYEKTTENDLDSTDKRMCEEVNENSVKINDKTLTPNSDSSKMLLKCNISKTMDKFHDKILILDNERPVVLTTNKDKQVPVVQRQGRKHRDHVNTKVNKQHALAPKSTEILYSVATNPLNVASCTAVAPTLGTMKCSPVLFHGSSGQSTSESRQLGTTMNFQTIASLFSSQSPSINVAPKTESLLFHMMPSGTQLTTSTASGNRICSNVKSLHNVHQARNRAVKKNMTKFSQIPNVLLKDHPNFNQTPRLIQQQSQVIVSQPVGSLMNQSIQLQHVLQSPLKNIQPRSVLQTSLHSSQPQPVFQSLFQSIQPQSVLQTQFPIQQSPVANVMLPSQRMFVQQQQQQPMFIQQPQQQQQPMFVHQQQQQQQSMLIPAAYLARPPFVPMQSGQVMGQQFNSNLIQFNPQIQTTPPYRQTESDSASSLQRWRFPLLSHTTLSQTPMIQPSFTNNFPSCQGQVNSVQVQQGCRPSNTSQSQSVGQFKQITKQKWVQNNKKFPTLTLPQQTSTVRGHSTHIRPAMSNYPPIFPLLKIKDEKVTRDCSLSMQTSDQTYHPIQQPPLNNRQPVANVLTTSSLASARPDKDKLSGTATSSQHCQAFSQIRPSITQQQQPMINSITTNTQQQQPLVNSITATRNYPPIFPLGPIKQEKPD